MEVKKVLDEMPIESIKPDTLGVTGVGLTGGSMVSGFSGWIDANQSMISLSITAITGLAGILFLYLNYRENRKRTIIKERESEQRMKTGS